MWSVTHSKNGKYVVMFHDFRQLQSPNLVVFNYPSVLYMSEISVSNDWTGYTVVFSPLSWLGVLIVVAASSMVVYLVSKAKCDRSARDAVVFAVASLVLKELDPSFASSSNATSMRIACLTMLLYGFIVFTAYTATMTSFLSVAVIGPGIENFRDLMESGKILLRF